MILKWMGGKRHLMNFLRPKLTTSGRLIEPFVGGGSVFFNVPASEYILGDTCQDLIDLYNNLGQSDIASVKTLFDDGNEEGFYYFIRNQFNSMTCPKQRAIILTYLNRHGYNGLYRLNGSGKYNVPFGKYKNPYFPESEIIALNYLRLKSKFYCQPFEITMDMAEPEDTIYCDPPYLGVSHTYGNKFGLSDQKRLLSMAIECKKKGARVFISNSGKAKFLYEGHRIIEITKGRGQDRKRMSEIIVEVMA